MIRVTRSHAEILEPSAGQVGCCLGFSFVWLLWAMLRLLPTLGERSNVVGPGCSEDSAKIIVGSPESTTPMLAAWQATSLEYVDAAAELCVYPALSCRICSTFSLASRFGFGCLAAFVTA